MFGLGDGFKAQAEIEVNGGVILEDPKGDHGGAAVRYYLFEHRGAQALATVLREEADIFDFKGMRVGKGPVDHTNAPAVQKKDGHTNSAQGDKGLEISLLDGLVPAPDSGGKTLVFEGRHDL